MQIMNILCYQGLLNPTAVLQVALYDVIYCNIFWLKFVRVYGVSTKAKTYTFFNSLYISRSNNRVGHNISRDNSILYKQYDTVVVMFEAIQIMLL